MIDDDYDGFGTDKKVGDSKKNMLTGVDKADEQKKILDDDFLGDLKLVDVPDSDDECYF